MTFFSHCLILTMIGLGCLFGAEAQAALDAARWRGSQAQTPVWWDNIEGEPFWLSGPQPRFHRGWKMHAISLQPGQTVTVHLPRGRTLRMHQPTSRLTRHDLDLSLDNGSGLHVYPSPLHSDNAQSLIVAPDAPGPFQVRITRPPEYQHPLTVALFLSRYDPLPVALYRDVIALDLPLARLRKQNDSAAQRFWSLKAYDPVRANIEGPMRLAIENRFAYDLTVQRPKQTYRIHTRLNGTPLRVLEFATDIEIFRPVFIRRKPQNVSRLEVDYVDILPGQHILEMETTAPVYLRLRRQSRADYALPSLNQPTPITHRNRVTPPLLHEPLWQIDAARLRQTIESLSSSVIELEYLAKRLWRDNRHRDGGLQAAMLLQRAAALRPHDAPLQRAATRQLGLSTMYRHLLPEPKTGAEPQYVGWFVTPRLAPLDDAPTSYAVAKQHQAALTSQLKSGYFSPLPAHPQTHRYIIPPRSAPSQLRVVVDTTTLLQPQELWIQFDQQPPKRLHLMKPPAVAASQNLKPAPGEIGLTLLRMQNPDYDGGTLGGPFSARHQPAPLLKTAYAVLPLPVHIHRVNVWQTYNRSEVASIALQYRVSKPFRLSERNYLDALHGLGSPSARHALVIEQLTALKHGTATFDAARLPTQPHPHTQRAAIEVVNQWVPLMRLLRARYKRFVDALAPPKQLLPPSPLADLEQRRARAEHAEATGDWLAALEAWAPIANASSGALRREAWIAQVRVLQHLGRHALADRLLRGMMLFDADARLRTQAFDLLLTTYRQTENTVALGTLLAVAAIRQQHPDALRMLLTQLVVDGQYQSALLLGLALPAEQRPAAPLLQSAWRLGWWQAFDDLLGQVNTAEVRHYWLGYRAVQQTDFDTAQQHFLQAGTPGQALAGAVMQARMIHADLRSGDTAKQKEAVLAWEAWQARHPGPHVWQREPQLVADAAGAMRLYQPALDLYSQWYRSVSERPVQLRFLGPLRLRLSIRPLHPQAVSMPLATPLNGRIRIDHDRQRHLVPITGNQPTHDLTGIDHPQWQPGQRITKDLQFGPGPHTVTISGENIPLLAQVEVQRPAQPLGILPPLTPHTLRAMLSLQSDLYSPVHRHLVDLEHRLRTPRPPPSNREAHHTEVARLVFQRDVTSALALPIDTSAEGLQQRMTLLLWQAEHQPERYNEAFSAAQSLLAEHPGHPGLFSLSARLARRSKWQRLATVQRSAGLHFAEQHGWQPESPLLRTNKTLLRPVDPDEQTVTGLGRLLITLNNLKATVFEIAMEAEGLPYTPEMPMTAVYQVDEQPPVDIHLPPSHRRHNVRLSVPAGQHALRFYIREPAVNQFLRLKIVETRRTSAQPLRRTFERAYHVATHTEPVEVLMAGPSWLRIDRWGKTGVQTHYQAVAAGWQTLTFYPKPGQREALFRLFQRIPAPVANPAFPRQSPHAPDLVPSPLAHVAPLKRHTQVELHDAYKLGGQEDGTWSFGGQLVSRRNTQEDVGLSDAERFVALGYPLKPGQLGKTILT